ncbi:MAG: hypothetical protein HZA90_05095 [Verrucomicrobia bacterium]|nr:hypothetical protein [Verrucomicrobiota bacterium]
MTLPPGSSLLRLGQVLLDAWEVGAHQWTQSPLRAAELKDEAAPGMPMPRDAVELFRVLEELGVPYLLVGGMAMLTYVQDRNTKDVDLLMSLESVRQIPHLVIEDVNEFFAHGRFHSIQVDFLLVANPFFRSVAERFSSRHKFAEREVFCATIEGLILLKLYALPSLYRQGDFGRVDLYEHDIAALIEKYAPDTDALFAHLEPHVSAPQLRELRSIVAEIDLRIARFRQRSDPRP